MRLSFLFVFLTISLVSPAQVYRGTIGKYPVVFEVVQDDYRTYQARYHYAKFKADILLKGDKEKNVFYTGNEGGENETFDLTRQGKYLKGSWQKKRKKLAVALELVDSSTIRCNYDSRKIRELKTENLYDYMKIEQLKLIKQREENWDGNTVLEWYTEPVTGTCSFRIKSSSGVKNIEKVNTFLTELHLDQVAACLQCMGYAPNGGDYTFTCKPMYFSSQLVSLNCVAGYYCGGAHPDFNQWGIVLDCVTMQELDLADLYWFGDPAEYVPDAEGEQNMSSLGEIWNGIVKEHYPDQMGNEDHCLYDDPSVWSGYDWCLTSAGLYIGAYFPRAARACDTNVDWPIIPYRALVKYRVNEKKYRL